MTANCAETPFFATARFAESSIVGTYGRTRPPILTHGAFPSPKIRCQTTPDHLLLPARAQLRYSRPPVETDSRNGFSTIARRIEELAMWRACFLAIGISMMIVGAECLAVEKVTWRVHEAPPHSGLPLQQGAAAGPEKEFIPAPWVPWSMLSGGAVVCLYSFTIPRRLSK
jgi:hypothetical protein